MLPVVSGIISSLLVNNLPKLAQAVLDKGVDYVEEKTGIKLEPDMQQEKIAELKLAAMQHEEFMQAESNKNTADARAMQVAALGQEDLFSKRFVYYLTAFWSAVTTAYIFMITFVNIPVDNVRFSDTVLGFLLGTVIATIMNYFLGSSNSSHEKTNILARKD